MGSDDIIKKGVIVSSFCGFTFEVELEDGIKIKAILAGKLRKFIKLINGDEVNVRLNKYDYSLGIICEKLTKVYIDNPVHKKKRSQINKFFRKKK